MSVGGSGSGVYENSATMSFKNARTVQNEHRKRFFEVEKEANRDGSLKKGSKIFKNLKQLR